MWRTNSTPPASWLAPLAALACLTAACSEGVGPAAAPSAYDASVSIPLELGTGQASFEAVPPFGGRVELIHGPQGGYHIYGRYRFSGFAPDVYVSFRVTPAEGGAPLNNATDRVRRIDQRGLVRAGSAWECASPELVILTAIPGPADVVGRRYRWEVFVRSAATGQIATAEREVTIEDDVP
jgi:hypothetical protein